MREIFEELRVTVTEFVELGSLQVMEANAAVIYHMFAIAKWTGGEPTMRGNEHSELRWFTATEARALQPLAFEEYRQVFESIGRLRP